MRFPLFTLLVKIYTGDVYVGPRIADSRAKELAYRPPGGPISPAKATTKSEGR